jgi:hypothetical protein
LLKSANLPGFVEGYLESRLRGPKLSNYSTIKASVSQEARGHAREEGGFWPCGQEFSAGLIFTLSCFASGQALIHQGVQGKFAKKKRSNSGKKK